MKARWKIALLFLFIVAVFWLRGGGTTHHSPDQKLVGHLDAMCKIAERGIESPYRGVQKLFHYYGQNTPDMFKEWGELLVTIERIKDDKAHDERARLAGRRLSKAISSCEQTYERFALAIEADERASQLLERGATRLGRTLELLLSGGEAGQLRFLPGLDELLLSTSEKE